jgi:hypothetical protein
LKRAPKGVDSNSGLDIENDSQLQVSGRPGKGMMTKSMHVTALLALTVCALALRPSLAAEPVTLTLKDHRFTPDQVTAPAGERFRIEVSNQDATPSEFESSDLRIEKIVVAGGRISVMAGPLKPGAYKFFDDYHPDSAIGTLTVIER